MIFNNGPIVRYKNATNPDELLRVINLRQDRLVNELGRIDSEKTYDSHDGIGFNFLAYEEDEPEKILGTVRIVDERDLKYLDDGKGILGIKNFDIEPYRGDKNLLVGRLVTSPNKGKDVRVLPGLFGCVYVYGYDYGSTDLFIIANCEINSGKIEIPKIYSRLGFEPIGEIKKKYYDDFDVNSTPMHATRERLVGKRRYSPKRLFFYEPFRKRIDFEYIPPEERKAIYKDAIKQLPRSRQLLAKDVELDVIAKTKILYGTDAL